MSEEKKNLLELTDEENDHICMFIKMFDAMMEIQRFSESHHKMVNKYIDVFVKNEYIKVKTSDDNPNATMIKLNIAGIINNRETLKTIIPEANKDIQESMKNFNPFTGNDSGLILPNSANKIQPVGNMPPLPPNPFNKSSNIIL